MDNQNGAARLRYLEEIGTRLRRMGFETMPVADQHLPVKWNGSDLCRVSGRGSVLYRQENVDSIRAQDVLHSVIDTAKMTSEYMAILEHAPQLKASGLVGDYRILADFGDAVLAGHPTERGVQFVTWRWDWDREGVHQGNYFYGDYEAAKQDFTVRSGLVQKDALFETEQLTEFYHALKFVLEQDESLSFGRDQELAELVEQVGRLLPEATLQQWDIELLEALEIGDAVKADCKVEKINSFYDVLKRTEMLTVNVEEMNYLAKRLDSFDIYEAAQFQAMAHKLELFELKDLINLTFCCQQATVITSFSDLASVGRDHYMNLHGGRASVDALNALDGEETARLLIEGGGGMVTPYGVVYDNGMELKQIYDGQFFPCYYYEPNAITVAVTAKSEPKDTEHITWLCLPMVQEEIDRALQRAGITDPADVRLRLENSQLPNEVDVLLDMEQENLSDLNALAQATDGFSDDSLKKLRAVVGLAKPQNAAQIKNPAENLDLFDFAPGVHTPKPWRNESRDEMLRMTLRVDGKPDYALVLPADEEYLDAVKAYLDIDVFADAMLSDIRFKVPYIGELICDTDCPAVEDYNDFAEALEDIWQKDGMLLTYAAVLDAEKPETLHRAVELLQDLDNYQRIVEGPYEYGQQRLRELLGLDDEDIAELEDYMDFGRYGTDCMEHDGTIETEFGMLRRIEPPFTEQQGLRMK